MRIIAGKHRGRKIELTREASHVRPTSDFTRQAIFNILSHGAYSDDPPFMDKPVLDVFCGTGAFGFEALSRGAAHVTFIDQSKESLAMARSNASRMGEMENVSFVRSDATQLPPSRRAYSLVFLDPPYDQIELIGRTLKSLHAGGWVARDAVVVIEHEVKQQPAIPEPYLKIDERRYGRGVISLLKLV